MEADPRRLVTTQSTLTAARTGSDGTIEARTRSAGRPRPSYSSGPQGASRRAGTCTPSSVTMEAEPTALFPKRLRMASTAAVASCQDCSRAVAL